MRLLPVPSITMPIRSRRAQYLTTTLDLQELDRYQDRAESALSETIAAYGKLGRAVDPSQWKCVRSKHGVCLFRARHFNYTSQTPLLCVGTLRGAFDDVMEGLYSKTTEEMLLMNAIKCPRLGESAVLYAVKEDEPVDPFAFTGVKWATIKLSVPSDREICYFDKMGMVRQASGKRMGYHVMQSVKLPECPLKAIHKRVQASACYLFEELDDNLVGVFMLGEVDSPAMSFFTAPAVADVLLAVTNALKCARAKKLAQMISAPSRETWSCSSSDKCCDVCDDTSSFFEHFASCTSCKVKRLCRKCRVKEHVLARDAASSSRLLRAKFCRVCIAKLESMTMDELRIEAGRAGEPGLRKTDSTSGCEMEPVMEEEGVEIPDSRKSLTAFSVRVSLQLQQLKNQSEARLSSLSSIGGASVSEDEDEMTLLEEVPEGNDRMPRLVECKEDKLVILEKEADRLVQLGSHSVASTASTSSCQDSEDATERCMKAVYLQIQKASSQVEQTVCLTKHNSQIADSVLESSRRRTKICQKAGRM